MSKTKLKIANRKDIFLYKTTVENLFINEFLPDAPGEYVKVYLFALMYAQYEEEMDSFTLAKTMGMTESEVDEAWDYWDANGIVKKRRDAIGGGTTIEFLRLVEGYCGKQSESFAGETDERLIDEAIREIYEKFQDSTGRTISRQETTKLKDALGLYEIAPAVMLAAIDYCVEINHDNVDYMISVARRWKEEGCEDEESVRELIEEQKERNAGYREIFRRLGFNRLVGAADREIMDRWFDQMGLSLEEILDACNAAGGVRDPNLKYVNKILENRELEKGGIKIGKGQSGGGSASPDSEGAKVSSKVLRDYYESIREEEREAQEARIKEASAIPGMREILEQESMLNKEILSVTPGKAGQAGREELRDQRRRLDQAKRSMLIDAGYPEDYLERKYRCDICKDTGSTDDGRVCSCRRARADEAYLWITKKNDL